MFYCVDLKILSSGKEERQNIEIPSGRESIKLVKEQFIDLGEPNNLEIKAIYRLEVTNYRGLEKLAKYLYLGEGKKINEVIKFKYKDKDIYPVEILFNNGYEIVLSQIGTDKKNILNLDVFLNSISIQSGDIKETFSKDVESVEKVEKTPLNSIEGLLGELDNSITSHSESEQEKHEKEVLKKISEFIDSIKEGDKKYKEEEDKILELIKNNGPLAKQMLSILLDEPKNTFNSIMSVSKKICNEYIKEMPEASSDRNHGELLNEVAIYLFKKQGLDSYLSPKNASDILENGDIMDKKTWFKPNYNVTSKYVIGEDCEEDGRWIFVKWDFELVLQKCKEYYGSITDAKKGIEDKWTSEFLSKYFIDSYIFLGRDNYRFRENKELMQILEKSKSDLDSALLEFIGRYVKGDRIILLNNSGIYTGDNYYGDYVDIGKFNIFRDFDRLLKSILYGNSISDTSMINNLDETVLQNFEDKKYYNKYRVPFGTVIEVNTELITDWGNSYKIYKNGRVDLNLQNGIGDKVRKALLPMFKSYILNNKK